MVFESKEIETLTLDRARDSSIWHNHFDGVREEHKIRNE
jgi:hypothetical protein